MWRRAMTIGAPGSTRTSSTRTAWATRTPRRSPTTRTAPADPLALSTRPWSCCSWSVPSPESPESPWCSSSGSAAATATVRGTQVRPPFKHLKSNLIDLHCVKGARPPQNVSVLTFTNPNYSPSAPDVVAAEKKTFSWQRWKYDRHQERVYDMQVDIIII